MAAYTWDSNWAQDATINNGADNLANAADLTSAAVDNNGNLATEVSIEVDYHASSTQGIYVYVLRDIDGTLYEAESDKPWGFQMPFTAGATHRRTFVVPGSVSNFKILVTNDGGQAVTVEMNTRQAVV